MAGKLLDTHVWAWTLTGDAKLSAQAIAAMNSSDPMYISPISFYEIAQKVRLGKWPVMETKVAVLQETLAAQGAVMAPFSFEIAQLAGLLDWPHRDPIDRILAATALQGGMELISADTVFDAVPGLRRVW